MTLSPVPLPTSVTSSVDVHVSTLGLLRSSEGDADGRTACLTGSGVGVPGGITVFVEVTELRAREKNEVAREEVPLVAEEDSAGREGVAIVTEVCCTAG